MYVSDTEKFNEWNYLKIKLHQKSFRPYFKIREVWWASIGQNIGDEQNGKNYRFERPILVTQKFYNNLFLALPLSRKIKDGDYYFRIKGKKVDGNIILSQGRVIDAKRLLRRIEVVDEIMFASIIKQYISLINKNRLPY